MKKRKYNIKNIVILITIIILSTILAGALLANVYVDSLLSRMNQTKRVDDSQLAIDETVKEQKKAYKVVNFALFGTDNDGNKTDTDRSDAIKVISLNYDLKNISITSLQRDMMIVLADESNDFDKINHAYWYGGANLAMATINYNFDLDINRYVTLSFSSLEKIVDIVGGVEIELSGPEAGWIHMGSGNQTLSGKKALEYARIRKIDSDYSRMDRQTKVIIAVINKIKSKNVLEILDIVNKVLPYVETNLSTNEIKDYLTDILSFNLTNINQYHVPNDDFNDTNSRTYKGYNPVYQLRSYEEQVKKIHKDIYGIDDYHVSQNVVTNEQRIIDTFGEFVSPN
ncbi:LCP family protein [Anaerorhabdus furcosa]|uniref:Transcriptional attenuator, LytR family n=1 Tax=Anaerorhabdus furcosa TaxID=118967 RepID=A0A1T4NED9_9FIRM|nr:LCP family protein [Anaerorhabdus furcosa]SJZ77367.1 transcriptional attenuator, LytR family [Anaerorhabdus furcosa]